MAGKDFFDVPKTIANTSEGELELPVLYYDVSVRQLNFWVDYEKALPKLEGTGLEPVRFSNNKTIVSMVFYNYRRTSVSSYEELGLAITAQPQSPKNKTRRLITIFGIPMIGKGISAYVLRASRNYPYCARRRPGDMGLSQIRHQPAIQIRRIRLRIRCDGSCFWRIHSFSQS